MIFQFYNQIFQITPPAKFVSRTEALQEYRSSGGEFCTSESLSISGQSAGAEIQWFHADFQLEKHQAGK